MSIAYNPIQHDKIKHWNWRTLYQRQYWQRCCN